MSALDQIAAARDDTFAARNQMLSMTAAQQVSTEDPGEPDHAVRADYAARVIRGDENPKMLATHVIASNPTIQQAIDNEPDKRGSNVPDNDIAFAISSIWTARAKAWEAGSA